MRVAVAVFESRVSPRFDYAPQFLVAEVDGGRLLGREIRPAEGLGVPDRVALLEELQIDALICGGVDGLSAHRLGSRGIELYSWVTGEAEDALACYLRGDLEPRMMMGAGGRCCGRWRFGGQGGQGGQGGRRGRRAGARGGSPGAGPGRHGRRGGGLGPSSRGTGRPRPSESQ